MLVVIAIIAILAAILFPVFAQAKEAAKRAKVLAETKQVGTAMQIYTSDYDDTFPIMHAVAPGGQYLHSANGIASYRLPAIPAGWGVNAAFRGEDSVAWQNSIFPYTRNNNLMGGHGLNLYTTGYDYSTAPANLPVTSLSANGLLNTWPATAIAAVSELPLLWFGNGKEAYRGYGYTTPYLRCTGTPATPAPPCLFNPTGHSYGGTTPRTREDTFEFTFVTANDTVRVFNDGNIIVRADTSAKFQKMGSTVSADGSVKTRGYGEPGFSYRSGNGFPAGNLFEPMRCVTSAGAPAYSSMFRPDSTFSYAFGTTGDNALCNN
ncbi:MAG: hypothetical protein MH204_10605 [Fimbriimonadaceae bacterium]|nr:hypothetical protein [Fimbriimonadaceae bacterium]